VYDVRYAYRGLRLSPGFATAALLSLALGIGANTAIFEILNALRLRVLPVSHPEQLVEVHITDMKGARGSFYTSRPVLTHPQWEQLRDHQTVFSGMFAWYSDEFNTAASGESHLVSGLEVTGDYFSVLGLQPAAGRLLGKSDDMSGCGTPAAVISYAYWKSAFASSPDVIGRSITLERHPFEIIGVGPKGFYGLEIGRTFDVAIPLCAEPLLMGEYNRLNSGRDWWLTVMGRLKPAVAVAKANSEVQSLSPGIFSATVPPKYPPDAIDAYRNSQLNAYSAATGVSQLRKEYSSSLWLLLAIAGVVTLIACANLANLLLARASAREREFAMRLALGASRYRLISQLMVESALLAAAGAVLALVLATLLSRYLVSFLRTRSSPVFLDVRLDYSVLLFTMAVGLLTCLLFGLAPALRASQADPGAALKNSGRGSIGGRRRFLLRRILVTTQVTLSLILIVSALLFTRSLHNLLTVNAGFDQDGLILASVDLSALKLPKEQRSAFRRRLVEEVKARAGIENAGETMIRPLSGGGWDDYVWMGGKDKSEQKEAWFNRVSPEFFATMHIPLLAGRTFAQTDMSTSPRVAIVNETFARTHLGNESPVGKLVYVAQTPSSPERHYEIVGVVKDAKYRSLKETMLPQVYLSSTQDDDPALFTRLMIRSRIGSGDAIHEINAAVSALAPEATIVFRVLRQDVKEGLAQERLVSTLALMFGVLATVLATVGLYGLISYMLALRTNEIGIRMALGADKSSVMRMIMSDATQMVFAGLLAGSLVSLIVGRSVAAMLFGLKPYDPGVILAACCILGASGVVASVVPALRAMRLDPMTALRQE
jgi:predicted permease